MNTDRWPRQHDALYSFFSALIAATWRHQAQLIVGGVHGLTTAVNACVVEYGVDNTVGLHPTSKSFMLLCRAM